MWQTELGETVPAEVKEEKKVVGSKADWYKKGNEYWNVSAVSRARTQPKTTTGCCRAGRWCRLQT